MLRLHHMMQNALFGPDFCILNVTYLENLIADMQNILGQYQQKMNETNTKQ
jgi:hypothetical protein